MKIYKRRCLENTQLVELYFKEVEMRHNVIWKTVIYWITGIVYLYIFPITNYQVSKNIGKYQIIFPFLSFLMTLFGMYHIKAETDRFNVVWERYKELRKETPEWVYQGKRSFVVQLISMNINKVILKLFIMVSTILFFWMFAITIELFYKDLNINIYGINITYSFLSKYLFYINTKISICVIGLFIIKIAFEQIKFNKKYSNNN